MAIVVHFKDGTTITNGQWTGAQELGTTGHFIALTEQTNAGPAPIAIVPTRNVQWVDLNG